MTVYCINPNCLSRRNPCHLKVCLSCGTPLCINYRYRLVSPLIQLDSGRHSEVWEVEDLGVEAVQGEQFKAMKVLKSNNKTLVRLFRQEAEVLKELNHPGLPNVALGDGYFRVSIPCRRKPLRCLVMTKIEGINLQRWVEKNGVVSQEKALEWLKQLLKILQYLHQGKSLIHRDIKPSNIMLQPSGQLKLIDLGTVRRMGVTYLVNIGMGVGGTTIFSPGYTPNEIVTDGMALPQSDFYSLGRTLVYLLTGIEPFNLLEQSGRLNWRERAPQVSPKLASWLDYLMASSPFERPPKVSSILNDLEGTTVDTIPFAPVDPPPYEPPLEPPQPWLIRFNFALFCTLLLTGSFWWHSQQDNQWQVFQQENYQTQMRR